MAQSAEPIRLLRVQLVQDHAVELTGLLHREGLDGRVTLVTSIAAAISELTRSEPDAVVVEGLPGLDLVEPLVDLVAIRSDTLPLIFVADLSDPDAVELMNRGARGAVSPSQLARLPTMLRRDVSSARTLRSRSRIEAELRGTEAQLRSLIETIDGIVYDFDGDSYEFLYVSPKAEVILGYPVADWKVKGFWPSHVHPDDVHAAATYWHREAAARRDHVLEYRMVAADSRVVWIHDQVAVVHHPDGRVSFRGIMVDVTKQKEAEATVRAIVEGTSSLVGDEFFKSLALLLGRVLDVQYVMVCEVVGWPALKARTVAFASGGEILPNVEYVLEGTPCAEVVGSGAQFFGSAVQKLFPADKDLAQRGIESYIGRPIVASNGRTIGHVVVMDREPIERSERIDAIFGVFTARAAAELERRRADAERSQLEAQLIQAQKMEAVGTLAGGIAHDFNNVLMGIFGNAEMAKDGIQEWHPAHSHLEEVLRATRRARDVVQRILTFSRKQEVDRRPLQLEELVTEALALARATLPATIEIEWNPGVSSPPVLADAGQVHQIVMNLASNAAFAIGKTPGRLVLSLEVVSFTAAQSQNQLRLAPGRYVTLTVRDTGSGMDQPTINRIFEPFFTTKGVGEGSGLGLAVVHGIMHAHDGAIDVQSELGRGTTFRLYFPVHETVTSREPVASVQRALGGGEHVLFIDDEPGIVRAARRMLERLGYRVSAFEKPELALQAFRDAPGDFDVVMSDFTMPGITGMDLASQIHQVRPDLPVVITTGLGRSDVPVEPWVAEVLPKPYSTEALGAVLFRALTSRRNASTPTPTL